MPSGTEPGTNSKNKAGNREPWKDEAVGEGWGQQHHCLASGGGQAPWGRKLAFFPCTGGALAR